MGNISVRVENGKLVYGLSVKTANGTWKDYKQSVNLPKNNSKHIVQLKYEAEPAATLSIWVDGVKGPVARAANGEKAAVSTGKKNLSVSVMKSIQVPKLPAVLSGISIVPGLRSHPHPGSS